MTAQFLLLRLARCDFTATRGNNFKLVKHYCKYDMRKYILLKELLTCGTICHPMLLTHVQLIASRLIQIITGVAKMSIMTINVILPELETVVTVTNGL